MFIIRCALLWIACVTICAVILANWLLLDHPGVYPDIFARNSGCAQSVIITSGAGLVLACLYMGAATDFFGVKEEICRKVVRALPNPDPNPNPDADADPNPHPNPKNNSNLNTRLSVRCY